MVKGSYEFVDLSLKKELEQRLEGREEKEQSKVFRVCQRCKVRKPLYQFSIDRRNTLKNGRTNTCKACKVIEASEYYQENKDKILARFFIYRETHQRDRNIYFQKYQKDHREHLKEISKKWYQENKETIKKRNLAYYNVNKEACNRKRKLWRENNKEKIKKYNREYKRMHK